MKKLFITAALAFAACFANAQDMMSKKGTPILPEGGDWSVGASATNLLNYFGNLFSQSGNNTSSLSPVSSQMITGKYMKDETTAFRIRFGINFGSSSDDFLVFQDGATDPNARVTDTRKISSKLIGIGVGLEKHRGKGRLHGIYGAEFGIELGGGGKTTMTYGNAFSATTGQATSTDPTSGQASSVGSRSKESKAGGQFGLGLAGFIGAEYFFAPKISISAEYGWGLSLNSTGEGESTTETADISSGNLVITNTTSKTGKGSDFTLGVSDIGSIGLNFYF